MKHICNETLKNEYENVYNLKEREIKKQAKENKDMKKELVKENDNINLIYTKYLFNVRVWDIFFLNLN